MKKYILIFLFLLGTYFQALSQAEYPKIKAKEATIKNLDAQIKNLSDQNSLKDKMIRTLKVKSFLKSSISGAIILVLTAVILL